MRDTLRFLKGHGTENDFVLLPDADGTTLGDLDDGAMTRLAAGLCDRRAGIGADGVLRVVRTDACDDPAAVAARGQATWFMDYRNADGSLSEMCGNGIRVFAGYLADREGVDATVPLAVATRGGVRTVVFEDDGTCTVDMGPARALGRTTVDLDGRALEAVHVTVGNPHAVALLDESTGARLAGLDLTTEPGYDRDVFPEGVNVELVARRGPHHVAMRVHERGSGETRSCGTGACAAAVAAALADAGGDGVDGVHGPATDGGASRGPSYTVDVRGGRLTVTWTSGGTVLLTGPAVLVAEGTVRTAALPGQGAAGTRENPSVVVGAAG